MTVETEPVWRALSSAHRRQMLDLLKDGPLTTGGVCKQMPGLSRFAVMQHLDVLVEANLVLIRKEGRQRLNFLNAMPLQDVYDRWVSRFSTSAANTIQHLKRYAESPNLETQPMNEQGFRVVKIELETIVHATPEKVFQALTSELDAWWPHRVKKESTVIHEQAVGGKIWEKWSDGGVLYGMITQFDPPRTHSSVAQGFMGACTISNTETVEAQPEGCRVTKSLRLWGEVPEEMAAMFREGSAAIIERALRAYCEEGVTR